MLKRCINCMGLYEDNLAKCPVCGYEKNMDTTEIQYLRPGVVLGNRYEIGRSIGAGGFGITYVAWDSTLNQKVAIKEYLPGEFSTRTPGETRVSVYGGEKTEQFMAGREKFKEESQRLARMRDVDGIVQIYDSFEENGTVYIVMEFLEGETLEERLKRDGKIAEKEAINIMSPILKALQRVHQEGILHRDIAPNNIFLCSDGKVKLLDFGAARSVTGTHSKSLTVLYKEGYTPEEQYRSRGEQGPWTDVYECAATFYRMVTGKIPLGAMERRRNDTLRKPSKNGAKVSRNVDIAVMNALNVTIEERTQNAEQFLGELTGAWEIKRHYVRTIERTIGKIPFAVKVGTVLCLVVIAGFVVLLQTGIIHFDIASFTNFLVPSGKARVINVVNMDQSEAETALEKAGLKLEVKQLRYSNEIMAGRIIDQSVEKGLIVDKGTTIDVVVSKEAEIVSVPEMIGKKWTDMQPVLDELCIFYDVEESASIEAPGYVIKQSVDADSKVEQGTTMEITVSKGMDYDTGRSVEVTDLIGSMYEDAKQSLVNEGVYLQVLDYRYDDNIAKGAIISQTAESGQILKGGDVIEVVVSKGIEQIEVPDLLGLNKDNAVSELEKLKFVPVLTNVVDESKEENTVLKQSVNAGAFIDKYSEIEISICLHGIEIPNLIGKTHDEADQVLKDLDLTVAFSYSLNESGNGTVSSQSISAGTVVEPESSITLTIGISSTDFTNEFVALVNEKRKARGNKALVWDARLANAAQKLHSSGHTSAEAKDNGYDWGWSFKPRENYGEAFWASRNRVSTPQDMAGRIQNTKIVTMGSYSYIGVYVKDDRIDIITCVR